MRHFSQNLANSIKTHFHFNLVAATNCSTRCSPNCYENFMKIHILESNFACVCVKYINPMQVSLWILIINMMLLFLELLHVV